MKIPMAIAIILKVSYAYLLCGKFETLTDVINDVLGSVYLHYY
jgi:hypothetical protein